MSARFQRDGKGQGEGELFYDKFDLCRPLKPRAN